MWMKGFILVSDLERRGDPDFLRMNFYLWNCRTTPSVGGAVIEKWMEDLRKSA